MDDLKGLHPEQQDKKPSKKTVFLTAGLSIVGMIFTLGMAHAIQITVTDSTKDRIFELEQSYDRSNEIIRLEQENLKVVTKELSRLKIQQEMKKEEPNMNEVDRLTSVIRNNSKK